jgi:nicotinate-nucleotide pyrophosphorylase (carboxylating)
MYSRFSTSALAVLALALLVLAAEFSRARALRTSRERNRGLAALEISPAARLDLALASPEQLALIPGLGPARARLIAAARELHGFPSASQPLSAIPGLGQNRRAALRHHLRLEKTTRLHPMKLEDMRSRLLRTEAIRELIRFSLEEDVGRGDITTEILVPTDLRGEARIIAKESGVICGLGVVPLVFEIGDADVDFQSLVSDGDEVEPGQVVAELRGRAAHLLSTERIVLNFLQRLSGIASTTQRYARALDGLDCAVLETRKTVPGWRLLDKYAVLAGGGQLHRLGLDDQILAKENHFALARRSGLCTSFAGALEILVSRRPSGMICEVEVETLDELDAALRAGVDIVLLDNMSNEEMREAVRRRDKAPRLVNGDRILLEASGGITLDTIRGVAETGVDRISIGALTHSVRALDLSMLVETNPK